ncbi:CsbA family protein [Bacillus xiapuensis]|uniref:CsbA family protein n=1 Tax=Bacillus xiapuensis TaxID=2014075 RepID=UPI000C242E78|nr:CsbA family protein [Bacillus xiapuensis]
MIDKMILAIFLPGLLVVFFSRVTFNQYLGLVLTVALIAASAYKGYTHTWLLIVIDAASLTIGFWLSNRMIKGLKLNK